VLGQPFRRFIDQAVQSRNEELATKDNNSIAIDPEILAVINKSTAVSTQHGNSFALLKVGSKRRRTRAELDELQHQDELRIQNH
jgi:hypothetical protein